MATRAGEDSEEKPETGLYTGDTKAHYLGRNASDGGPPEVVRATLRFVIKQKNES